MLLVLIIALVAIALWAACSEGAPRSKAVTILWLVAQVFLLATALHYMNRYWRP